MLCLRWIRIHRCYYVAASVAVSVTVAVAVAVVVAATVATCVLMGIVRVGSDFMFAPGSRRFLSLSVCLSACLSVHLSVCLICFTPPPPLSLWLSLFSTSAAQSKRTKAAGYQRMSSFRRGLPAWEYRDTIVDMVRNHQVHAHVDSTDLVGDIQLHPVSSTECPRPLEPAKFLWRS